MLTKRIIPCLDIKDGRTVKGVNFENLRDAGDPVELGEYYARMGADELVFLDISATIEKRKTFSELVRKIAQKVNIPFTVGGGISSAEDVSVLLEAGADKVSVNTAAVKRPELISELADRFGSQCVVVAIDAKSFASPSPGPRPSANEGPWKVFLNGGRTPTDLDVLAWAKEAVRLGAGELLLTSMDHDGTKNGFAAVLTEKVSSSVSVPVIASGGAGTMDHFEKVFSEGKADAALAASIFHFREIDIRDLKKYLFSKGIAVRI